MAQSTFYMIDSTGQNWQVHINTSGDFVADPVSTVGTTPGVIPAGTYTAQDAITQALALSHKPPATTMQYIACDAIQSLIWQTYPWSWTQASLTAIATTDGIQDYAHSQTDFYRFANLRLVNTSVTPNKVRDLSQKNHIGVELVTKGGIESINSFSWEPAISKIRLEVPLSIPSGTVIQIQGEYQRFPVKILASNVNTALNLPDIYFPVYLAGLLWRFYRLTDDARAGTASINPTSGRWQYTGQLAEFFALLGEMKRAEDLSDGEDVVFPGGGTLGEGRDSFGLRLF